VHDLARRSARIARKAWLPGVAILACAIVAFAAVNGPGPLAYVYETTFTGAQTAPNAIDPAHFNTTVWGSNAPPAADLLGNTSTFDGARLSIS